MLIESPMPLGHPQALEKREERAFGHEPRVGALPPGGKSTCIVHTSVAILILLFIRHLHGCYRKQKQRACNWSQLPETKRL